MNKETKSLRVASYDIEYTGGGFWVAYGVYTNGQGFSLGCDSINIYDEDARHQFEYDDTWEWEQQHMVDWNGDGADEFGDTLRQIWKREKRKTSVYNLYMMDIFGDNKDILH